MSMSDFCITYLNETKQLKRAHLAIHRYKLGLSYLNGIIPGTRDKLGIIPGTRDKLVKMDMDPFMQILRDELSHLQTFGVKIQDASKDYQVFYCKPSIVNVVSDYRGLELFLGLKGSPARHPCFK